MRAMRYIYKPIAGPSPFAIATLIQVIIAFRVFSQRKAAQKFISVQPCYTNLQVVTSVPPVRYENWTRAV